MRFQKNIILAAAVVLSLCGCGRDTTVYDATGNFEATEIVVSAEVNGRIVDFPVTEGSTVVRGATLGLIDTTQLHLQHEQLAANIEALRSSRPDMDSQLAPLREQLDMQRRELNRAENLAAAGAATSKQLDDLRSAVAVLERQIAAQRSALSGTNSGIEAQIAAASAQMAQIDDQIRRCSICAPIDGTILTKYSQAGELAMAGRPLFKIADVKNIYLKAYLTSSQLPQIATGGKVRVFADFGGGERREYEGVVTWISERSEFTPKNIVTSDDRANMVYAVKVAVPNDGYIKIGMYGGIKFMS